MLPVRPMPSWQPSTDKEYKEVLAEELSIIFQKILRLTQTKFGSPTAQKPLWAFYFSR